MDWLRYLRANSVESPLNYLFMSDHGSVYNLMKSMDIFFKDRDEFSAPRERGDRLKISEKDGTIVNLELQSGTYSIVTGAKHRAEGFIKLLASHTCWGYDHLLWSWNDLTVKRFTKNIIDKNNGATFAEIVASYPLSWAITAQKRLEYTLEKPDKVFD
jgi:hypothetical protein